VLIAQTGESRPFTMRVDQAPFRVLRVRQALRLIVNPPQMAEQDLTHGAGSLTMGTSPSFDSLDWSTRKRDSSPTPRT
jgi:ABC-type oligopeptide transport system substrate-binding subunit